MDSTDFDKELTEAQKKHLRDLFWDNHKYINKELEILVNEDLYVLGKYKGELSRAYGEVKEQRNTLIFMMKEISDKQDDIVCIMGSLNEYLTRIENLFFGDAEKREQNKKENELLNKPIEHLELTVRTQNCLKSENINTIKDLIGWKASELLSTPNLGKKSFTETIEKLGKYGLTLAGSK